MRVSVCRAVPALLSVAIVATVAGPAALAAEATGQPAQGSKPVASATKKQQAKAATAKGDSLIGDGQEAGVQPPRRVLSSAELDAMLAAELGSGAAGATVSDEQFLRRASLDLIGRQPTPAELARLAKGAASKIPTEQRRAAAIERLLASEEFGRNWANYWSDTISYRVPPPELHFLSYGPLKDWLAEQFNQNVGWDKIAAAILSASGMVKENPPATFVAYHQGNAPKLAAETARIFLGVQIQCAECHDHPFENWQREQFHELAAFFARAEGKLPRTLNTNDGTEATVKDRGKGEHVMPNAEDPQKPGTAMAPVFLTGSGLTQGKGDAQRRELLARMVTSADNPWFARSYVNRVWSRLMGHGFVEPVDDLGELRTHYLSDVHSALAESFVATGFDVKQLFRLVLNSRLYQRPLPAVPTDANVPFAAARPGKLRGDEVFASLVTAIALPNTAPPPVAPTPEIRFPPPPKSTRDLVAEAFGFDPSLAPDEVFRTMGQAMWLMNNEQLQAQINAEPDCSTMLSRLLASEPDDRKAFARLFQRVMARKPSAQEIDTALGYLADVDHRGEAFEDLLWSLINSAEFTTKR